jgi:hypothetical protein
MAFCTVLEWDASFPFDRYQKLNTRAGDHDALPAGCLARVVGPVEQGALIVEVWQSDEHAKRFSDKNSHLIAELQIPPPSRVAAFEPSIFQARETTS